MKVRTRDSGGTRRAILDAAQRLFARNGFSGTSMREIAKASGVSQPLIHHYFGSKEGLYRAIKQRLMEQARDAMPLNEDTPRDISFIGEFIRSAFLFLRKNDDLLRLSVWSNLEGESSLWPEAEVLVHRMFVQILNLQTGGFIRRELDPLLLLLMAEALTLYWCQNRSYYLSLFNEEAEEVDDRYLNQVLDVMLHGIKPRSKDEGPSRL
ncbi:MAG TPA: TetR/AcrR family transcriptional regulator [Syntrophobacter fumaroxidans]|nr:TetR/AcrR family transcriptional regulator [Syntrophobacter fumaroxidans]